jgi:hypothetical protein
MERPDLRSIVVVMVSTVCAASAQQHSARLQLQPSLLPDTTAVREIHDPHSGMLWLLVKDKAHPGGPGRLIPVSRATELRIVPVPLIRAGDRIQVEEHTAVVDAVLEATALEPAIKDGLFLVRLKIGGRVLRVAAVAAGIAELRDRSEIRP